MKRFSETEKWRDPWFHGLPHGAKLLFLYICDSCNNAGFYEENIPETCFHLSITPDQYEGACKALQRGIKGASGWLWVKRFLRHQKNEPLKPENPAHRQIIRLIQEQLERFGKVEGFSEFEAPYKGLLRPIGTGTGTGKNGERMQGEREKKATATKEEIVLFFASEGLEPKDAEWFFQHCVGSGWTNNGKPIRDWKATVRSWRAANYLPSQKAGKQSEVKGRV